jgi:hypothetical protein
MARIRSINPSAPKDEDVARLSLAARYAWAFLPCHADREGRLRDSAFTLKAEIFPGDQVDMEALLAELAAAGFIVRYEVDGRRFIQIRSFLKHQAPHTRETPSTIPPQQKEAKPGRSLGSALAKPRDAGVSPSPSDPDLDLDPDRGAARPPARSEPRAKIWTSYDWFQVYAKHWSQRYGLWPGGDSKASGRLADALESLTETERITAQARAPDMLREFLESADERTVARRHPWSFFVTEWSGLRVPKLPIKPRDNERRPPELPTKMDLSR